ncbi:Htaa protein [Jatrophihabitans endophyticus]|uniref:Htaa protein n=1 Tax=Jatrophihabitans endophyticus TaxID=1206085 RepID=A0A1M5PUX0_9ACTN|nr:HtaA domain-containing protein [Jatrophihabitans endophyticus]SHH05628.1 Htaa protein [Jatrophihabitans endophyticus]
MSAPPVARLLVAGAITVVTALVPAVAPGVARAESTAITTGSLHWGFKQSFRSYVTDAGIATSKPATRAADGAVDFPLSKGTYDAASGTTSVTFTGGVHFRAHADGSGGYLLDITLSSPQLTLSATGSTLTMAVTSRQLLAGDQGGPVKDYGRIPVANLDPASGTVQPAAAATGTTAWSAIPATLTADAVPAFLAYPTGTALDPVAFRYTGPGGAPRSDEVFTGPAAPLLERAATWSDPKALSLDALYPDPARGLVYVVRGNSVSHAVQVLDATTMAELGGDGALGTSTAYLNAFDPDTGTVFALQDDGTLAAARWTGSAWATDTVATVTDTVTGLAWDRAHHRLLAIGTTDSAAAVVGWTHSGGQWDETTYALPAPPAASSIADGWYGRPRQVRNLAVDGDGTLVLARTSLDSGTAAPAVLRIAVSAPGAARAGAAATVSQLAGTAFAAPAGDPAPNVGYSQVVAGGDGSLYLLRNQNTSTVTRLTATGVDRQVTLPDTIVAGIAVDDDAVIYAGAPNNKQLIAIRDGVVLRRQAVTDLGSRLTFVVATGAGHSVYAETRTAFPLGVTRFTRAGLGPSVTGQPAAAHVAVTGAGDSAGVTFTATGDGDPQPTVRWQVRTAGAAGFTDVPGATDGTLSVDATATDDGSAYRAVFTNAAGAIASEPAALQVDSPASITESPSDSTVVAGRDAFFAVTTAGGPAPTVTWQADSGAGWVDVTTATPGYRLTGTALAVTGTSTAQTGLRVRATAVNALATAVSDPAILTVTAAPTPPGGSATATPSTGVTAPTTAPTTTGADAGADTVTAVAVDAAGPGSAAGATAATGVDVRGLLLAGAVLAVAGAAVTATARRRAAPRRR